jgi:hypothetical protein
MAGVLAATVFVAVPATALVTTTTVDPSPKTYDGTTPSLTVSPVQFVVGSSIDAAWDPNSPYSGCELNQWNEGIPLQIRWTSSDNTSKIAGYDVWERGVTEESHPEEVVTEVLHGTQSTSYRLDGGNHQGDCGPLWMDHHFWVVARDNRGNSASSSRDITSQSVNVWLEDGATPTERYAALPVTRTGTWSTANCQCFNHGRTLYSTAAGASLTYRVTTTKPGQTAAVVAEKNSNRGRVNISVDGGTAVSVDTYASSPTHRVIAWQKTLSVGTHTLKLSNAGTTARSRVDIDTILLTD